MNETQSNNTYVAAEDMQAGFTLLSATTITGTRCAVKAVNNGEIE